MENLIIIEQSFNDYGMAYGYRAIMEDSRGCVIDIAECKDLLQLLKIVRKNWDCENIKIRVVTEEETVFHDVKFAKGAATLLKRIAPLFN